MKGYELDCQDGTNDLCRAKDVDIRGDSMNASGSIGEEEVAVVGIFMSLSCGCFEYLRC